jgi:predicted PurR-regulated permease PerM
MSDSRITPATLYKTVLLAFGLVIAGLVFAQLVTLFLAVLIVVVISLPLTAAATMLQRLGIPRAIGAALALLLALGTLGATIALIVPIFTHEINQFIGSLPSIVDEIRHRLGRLTGGSPSKTGAQLQHFVNGYTQHPSKLLGPLASIGESVVAVLAAAIVVVLTALYTAIHPEPLVDGLVRVVSPSRRRQAEHILSRLADSYLGWLRGLVVGMVVLGSITYVGLLIVGLPFAAFFAVFTAIAMIIPYFGALFSSIPPILFALTISPGKAVIVAIIYVVAHQAEGAVIQPLVIGRTVKLHPAVVAIGVVAVEQLFGIVGLIVAVPILSTIKILIEELWIKPVERTDRSFTGDLASGPVSDLVSVAGTPSKRTVGVGARSPE